MSVRKITLSERNQARDIHVALFHSCKSLGDANASTVTEGSCLVSGNEGGREGEIIKGQEETLR